MVKLELDICSRRVALRIEATAARCQLAAPSQGYHACLHKCCDVSVRWVMARVERCINPLPQLSRPHTYAASPNYRLAGQILQTIKHAPDAAERHASGKGDTIRPVVPSIGHTHV